MVVLSVGTIPVPKRIALRGLSDHFAIRY